MVRAVVAAAEALGVHVRFVSLRTLQVPHDWPPDGWSPSPWEPEGSRPRHPPCGFARAGYVLWSIDHACQADVWCNLLHEVSHALTDDPRSPEVRDEETASQWEYAFTAHTWGVDSPELAELYAVQCGYGAESPYPEETLRMFDVTHMVPGIEAAQRVTRYPYPLRVQRVDPQPLIGYWEELPGIEEVYR